MEQITWHVNSCSTGCWHNNKEGHCALQGAHLPRQCDHDSIGYTLMSSVIYFLFIMCEIMNSAHKIFLHVFIHSNNSLWLTVAAAGKDGTHVIADQRGIAEWTMWSWSWTLVGKYTWPARPRWRSIRCQCSPPCFLTARRDLWLKTRAEQYSLIGMVIYSATYLNGLEPGMSGWLSTIAFDN